MPTIDTKVDKIGDILNDTSRPLKERFRALFTLRNLGGESAISAISKCFCDPSALLKHELAYCLGQMQDTKALPILESVLKDVNENPMVRHEAGEALGAIGSESSLPLLEEYCNDSVKEVAETCKLAIDRIKWLRDKNETKSPYLSVDPAPSDESKDVDFLETILLDNECDIFKRYKAMFALRDINSKESVLALCEGLNSGSALFQHEVAFVLGQLQNGASVPYLIEALKDTNRNEMVRHECAEALGSIATEECFNILKEFQKDNSRVVRESCDIALDMADYELSGDFQYADSIAKV